MTDVDLDAHYEALAQWYRDNPDEEAAQRAFADAGRRVIAAHIEAEEAE